MNKPENTVCHVVIYDDETPRAEEWKEKLMTMGVPGLDIRVPSHEEIQSELDELYERRKAVDDKVGIEGIKCALDAADILVVDYDLRHLEGHRDFATGEEIAYSARLFSKVKIIVVVNHPDMGLNNFDLTLQRDRNLKADVYIGHEQIANPVLWRRNLGHDGYHPWSWPALLEDVWQFDKCLVQVRDNLDNELLRYFGLDQEETCPSPEMLAFLGIRDPETTFRQIIKNGKPPPFVRPKDEVHLLADEDRLCRVLTSVLRKWFRKWILPSQTVLADAPHLASVLPWGLSDYTNQAHWDAIPKLGTDGKHELATLFRPEALQHQFGRIEWIGRPTFFVQVIRNALETNDGLLTSFEYAKIPKILFAEDLSRFILSNTAIEYDLSLDGHSQVRAVCDPDAVPIVDRKFDPKAVIYVPQSLMV
jgi:hypothetical protein